MKNTRYEANSERNAKIIALYADGYTMSQIADAARGSRGLVAGVINRAGIKNRGGAKHTEPVVAPSIIGKVFGRLTVLEQSGSDKYGSGLVRCLCSCGKTCVAKAVHVVSTRTRGKTQSCGCLIREAALNRWRKVREKIGAGSQRRFLRADAKTLKQIP